MPNWCAGTLKIRGEGSGIRNFIENGLTLYSGSFDHPTVVDKSKWLYVDYTYYVDTCDDKWVGYHITPPYYEGVHVNDTNRAFICGDQYLEIPCGESESSKIISCLNFKQAWDIRSSDWVGLSKKWNLDFRLFGFESGMEFCREVEVIKGEITMDKTIKYDDWLWECPMPGMGG